MLGVLIVDDEYYIREMLKNAIDWEANGFEIVGEAGTSMQAAQLASHFLPDLVLLDINLPDEDGFSVAEAIIDEGRYKPEIIIITGYDSFPYAKKAITYEAFDYLLKPVADAELLRSVTRARTKILAKRQNCEIIKHLTEEIKMMLPLVDSKTLEEKAGRRLISELENTHHIVNKVLEYVEQHLYEADLSVESISANLYLNMSYLSHLFKKVHGKGLNEYILTRRMEAAFALIGHTNDNVEQVSQVVGFKSAAYFSKCLKRFFGLSFAQIRQIQKKYEEK